MRRWTAAAVIALAIPGCDVTDPDHPRLEAGPVLQGSVAAGQTVVYAVRPSTALRLLFRATSGSAADTLVARLVDEAGADVAVVVSAGSDTALHVRATEWLPWRTGERWILHITRRSGSNGAFEVQLFPRSDLPERAPRRIAVAQRVDAERIDVGEDVDEFSIVGSAGDEWIVFVQAERFLTVEVLDSLNSETVAQVGAHSYSPILEQHSSGRFILARSGTYLVRVLGRDPTPFTIRVARVNRAPETTTPATTVGAIVAEVIGEIGDIDEFTFSGAAGQEINLLVQAQSGLAAGILVQLFSPTTGLHSLEITDTTATLDERGTGRFTLPEAGTYTIRVTAPPYGDPARVTGQYRFELYPIDRRPEDGGVLAIDAAPISGTIDRPGDIDEFTLTGTVGQLAVLYLDAGAVTGSNEGLMAQLVEAGTPLATAVTVGSTALGGVHYGVNYAYRVRLPATGTYTVRVGGAFQQSLAKGGYTLELYTVSAAPEHVPATVQVGQVITGEQIDRPGDLDVFTIAADSGREVNLFLGSTKADGELYAKLDGELSQAFVSDLSSAIDAQSTGRFRMAGRPYVLTMDSHWAAQAHRTYSASAYSFRVFPIDRAPESRPAPYTLGDTITGEVLYPAGDIDEYTFSLADSTPVRSFWEGMSGAEGPTAHVYNEAGSIVWGVQMTFNGERVTEFTLPPGQYRLSVLNPGIVIFTDPWMAKYATLPYRIALTRR